MTLPTSDRHRSNQSLRRKQSGDDGRGPCFGELMARIDISPRGLLAGFSAAWRVPILLSAVFVGILPQLGASAYRGFILSRRQTSGLSSPVLRGVS